MTLRTTSDILRDPEGGESLLGDERASVAQMQRLTYELSCGDVLYWHHVTAVAHEARRRLHPAAMAVLARFVLDPRQLSYIVGTPQAGANDTLVGQLNAVLSLLGGEVARAAAADRLAGWLAHPDREVRTVAARALGREAGGPERSGGRGGR